MRNAPSVEGRAAFDPRRFPSIHEKQNRDECAHAAAADRDGAWGIALTEFGGWTAARSAAFPTLEAGNMLSDFSPDAPNALEELDAVIAWVEAARCGLHLRLDGALARPEISRALMDRGFLIKETEAWMAADPATYQAAPLPPGVSIQSVSTDAELKVWTDLLTTGWGVEPERIACARAALAPGLGPDHWRRFLAYADGEPVGEALLTFEEGGRVAYLADAAVVPLGRGRGAQRALIAARMACAREAGAEVAFAGATYGSVSHANMAKAGLALSHVTLLWFRAPSKTR